MSQAVLQGDEVKTVSHQNVERYNCLDGHFELRAARKNMFAKQESYGLLETLSSAFRLGKFLASPQYVQILQHH